MQDAGIVSVDPTRIDTFVYSDWRFDGETAEFDFALEGADAADRVAFTERVAFAAGSRQARPSGNADRVERVLALLGGVLGASYFKAAAPGRIRIDAEGLTPEGVEYLRAVYREGLAEFAYRAGLPGKVEPVIEHRRPARASTASVVPQGAPLVPIGGGKDSVVSVESLRAAGVEPVQFAVNPNVVIRRVAAASGLPLVEARRTIDRALLELNERGALNGHVPVTAMNSLIAIAQAQLLGLGPVVMSNESSASDPTLDWNGEAVNHQWSKSLEAERMLASVLEPQAGIAGAYFSLLRPFTELRIARAFAKTDRYDASIVSCNRAFRMGAGDPGWCGDCDKCRFVFLALSAVMPPDRLVAIIGKDMFADETQLPGYRALMGLDAHKPFECVGEEAECTVAASLASRHPHWAASPVLRALHAEIPHLAEGSVELEEQVFGEAPADRLSSPYAEARYALV